MNALDDIIVTELEGQKSNPVPTVQTAVTIALEEHTYVSHRRVLI
jgi:hypothetical protein